MEDDEVKLSTHALNALLEFYEEQQQRKIDDDFENWQLSQFWYDDETATVLAKECLKESCYGSIACISCPTLYSKILEMDCKGSAKTILLEYDKRFSKYGSSFIFYNYNDPLNLPSTIKEINFDIVVADPPFLSEECLTKVANTIKLITKKKILLCTGAVMEDIACKLLCTKKCRFIPQHKNNLANDFACYTNYDSEL